MDRQNEALREVTVHLIGAIGLLRFYHSKAGPTQRHPLFMAMIADYERAAERGKGAINWNN